MSGIAIDPVFGATLRVAFALLFGAAAFSKWRDFHAFRAAVSGYALLPERFVGSAAAGLVAGEVAVAVALVVGPVVGLGGPAPSFLAAALLTVYTLAIAINLARGRRSIDCGCGGPGVERPLSGGLLARNTGMIALLLLAAAPMASRAWLWVDALSVVAGAGALTLLYHAAELAASHALRAQTEAATVGGGR